jgi:hypothetical protein
MMHAEPMTAGQERDTLKQVNQVYELLERTDLPQPRWGGRGVGLRLTATIKPIARSKNRFGRGTLLRLSTRGMLLSCSMRLGEGDLLLVKVGRWGTDQFSFPCRVRRVRELNGAVLLSLAFSGKPLRVRYGAA